jgi:hypothetical protein
MREEHYGGLVKVHRKFDEQVFGAYVERARQVTILNTWIPNLELLRADLERVLKRRAEVRVLLLHPKSLVTDLRDRALRERGVNQVTRPVREEIERCLDVLESIHSDLDERRRGKLKVRVYNSLPAVSVYRADDHYLVSMFLHGQLAIDSPQFEIDGTGTRLGQQIQKELDTLWNIGHDVDLANWQRDIDLTG